MADKDTQAAILTSSVEISAWLPGLTGISDNIGQAGFDQSLFTFLNDRLAIDHFAVFTYSSTGGPGHLFTKSIMPADEAEGLAKDYVDEYHQRDPLFGKPDTIRTDAGSEPVHPSINEEYDAEYRDHFFTQHDLVDKISLTRKVNEEYLYCNFYRIGESGQFTGEERELFRQVLPFLVNLIACHFAIQHLSRKSDAEEETSARSLVHSVISSKLAPFDKLTAREAEVCERILVGFTSTGIGLDLGIAESSVNTYRRRAYEKLGIATQNELFSLCISALNRLNK